MKDDKPPVTVRRPPTKELIALCRKDTIPIPKPKRIKKVNSEV